MSLKISQDLQDNTCSRVSFLIKLQDGGWRPATFLEKHFGTGVFLWILLNFNNYNFCKLNSVDRQSDDVGFLGSRDHDFWILPIILPINFIHDFRILQPIGISSSGSRKFKGRWLFSKMNTKCFKKFFCIGNADIKPSDLIVRKNLSYMRSTKTFLNTSILANSLVIKKYNQKLYHVKYYDEKQEHNFY